MTATADYMDMDRLREARKAGWRVEIFRLNDNLNESGYEASADWPDDARGARLLDEAGHLVASRSVDADEVRELLKLGAVEV